MAQDKAAQEKRTWLVTGCGSGLGLSLANMFVTDSGDNVVITARKLDAIAPIAAKAPERMRALTLDIRDKASVQAAVDATLQAFGRIDVLVNNAGLGQIGAIEELDDEETDRIMGTNYFGTLNMVRAVLPHMRVQRSGRIFTLTSMGGFRGRPGVGIYNSSKFALEGMHEALAGEVASLGIQVSMIQPGLFRSDFRGRTMQHAKRIIPDYADTSGKNRASMKLDYPPHAAQPSQIAAAIIAMGEMKGQPPLRLQLGSDAVTAVKDKLKMVTEEFERWESVAHVASTGGEGSVAAYREALNAVGS